MTSRFILPFADVGTGIAPSSGALLYFYESDSVDTKKDTYSDAAGTIPNANPVEADSLGVFPDIFITGNYKVVLTTAGGDQSWEADPVSEYAGVSTLGGLEVNTVSEIQVASLAGTSSIQTLGYATAGDGGHALYYADTADTSTADDGFLCVVSADGVRFKLQLNDIINARWAGVRADSDGTTGSGTDDAAAWQLAIDASKTLGLTLIGPSGLSRILSTIDMTRAQARFYGTFIKDFDGNGIDILDGGPVYTTLHDPAIIGGKVTESDTSLGFNVRDSRVKIYRGITKNNGGSGYYHLDDIGNNNHSVLELIAENNGGTTKHNVHIDAGAQGDDSNNWVVDLQTFGGGGGVLIDADCKDWTGRIKAEDSTLEGLKFTAGSRYDLNVYLENNTVNDYDIGDNASFVTLTGRLGGGTTNSNETYCLRSGGNDRQVKGDTVGVIERIGNTNLSNSGSEYMTRRYNGSSAQVCFKERYFGNSDWRAESIDRTDDTTVQAMIGLDASAGAVMYGDGTSVARLYTGIGTPEGVVSGNIGDIYTRKDGGAGTTLYVKEADDGLNTGWAAM